MSTKGHGSRPQVGDPRVRDGVETSFGGVAVRGREVLVITPTGRRRVTALPKGGPKEGETGEEPSTRQPRSRSGASRDSARAIRRRSPG